MDKFGIFNLLNSFFNFYGDNKNNNLNKNPDNTGSNKSDNFNVDNLFSAFNKNNSSDNMNVNATNKENENIPPSPSQASYNQNNKNAFIPLQNEMLSTMKNHDAIIKRVKERERQKNKI